MENIIYINHVSDASCLDEKYCSYEINLLDIKKDEFLKIFKYFQELYCDVDEYVSDIPLYKVTTSYYFHERIRPESFISGGNLKPKYDIIYVAKDILPRLINHWNLYLINNIYFMYLKYNLDKLINDSIIHSIVK